MNVDVRRYASFTNDPTSGNPVGVVVNAGQLTEQDMLGIAAGSATQKPRSSPRRSPIDVLRQGRPPDFQGRSYWMICPAVDTQPAQMSAAQNRSDRFWSRTAATHCHDRWLRQHARSALIEESG
jgi:hypothetical protein